MCPNVFVNVELVNLLADHYDLKHKAICDPSINPQIHFSKEAIGEVFKLEGFCNGEIIHEELEKEFLRMDTIYKGWRLPIHRDK